jgi:hypothetical protein
MTDPKNAQGQAQNAGPTPTRDSDQAAADKRRTEHEHGCHPSPRPTDDPSSAPESGDRKH